MSTIIDRPAALDASPRPCLFLSGSFADCLATYGGPYFH